MLFSELWKTQHNRHIVGPIQFYFSNFCSCEHLVLLWLRAYCLLPTLLCHNTIKYCRNLGIVLEKSLFLLAHFFLSGFLFCLIV